MDWMHLAQDRDQRLSIVNTNEPSGSIKGGEFLDQEGLCSMELYMLLYV